MKIFNIKLFIRNLSTLIVLCLVVINIVNVSAKTNNNYLNNTIEVEKPYIITKKEMVMKIGDNINQTTNEIINCVSKIENEKEEYEAKLKADEERKLRNLMDNASENVPNDESGCRSIAKTYMGYTAVTCKSSPQYKLLNSKDAYTDPDTGLRMYQGRYCIALGSYYATKIGTKINLELENGTIIECVLGDQKSDAHTDPTHRYHSVDGSVAEFIVDNEVFKTKKDSSGTVNFIDGWDSKIIKVVVVK